MKGIKTLVYFDIEATGLKSSGRPRITEISLVAVNMDDTLRLSLEIKQNLEGTHVQLESLQPRIVNKLTLCVYPMATIVPHVSDITGLDNYMLNGQSKFDKSTGNLLNSFLSHLPSPVCLVAHNGDCYDFPLLKSEMEKVNTPLDPLILCVDSYIGIKNIFKKKVDGSQSDTSRNKNQVTYQPCSGKFWSAKKMKFSPMCIPSSFSLAPLGQDWLDWVQENSYLIEGCKAMWHMV